MTYEEIAVQIKLDFENLAEEHLIAESNENLWAKGADSTEQERLLLENAATHAELYKVYKAIAKNPQELICLFDR